MYKRICNLSKNQSFFLFGPRGSGKSTLLCAFFKEQKVLWIDLLEQKTEMILNQNPDHLLALWEVDRPEWIVIDEVQKIPRILDVVHSGIEKYHIKFALTGSSARKLKKDSANLLANRAASFQLSPLSYTELENDFNLDKALRFGLLPRFWSEKNLTEKDIERALYSYVNTYLKEEIASEQLVRKLDPFRRFLISAAQSNGKIINYSKIERDAGISHSQAERHFDILCDTLIGRFLPPFERSVRKRQSKKSKFYFFDTGVLRAINSFLEEGLHPATYEYGDLFETFLINEFFKLKESLEKPWNFSYLRTVNDVEIDLIIELPRGPLILVEIKSTDKIQDSKLTSFCQIAKEFKLAKKYVLSRDPRPLVIDGIRCLPWQQGLCEIFF